MAIAVIALSLGAINMLIPIIVIIILIAAAGASMRGYDIFNVFGVAALMGISTRGTMAKQNPLKTVATAKFRGKVYTMTKGKTAGKLNAYAKRQKAANKIRGSIAAGAAAGAVAADAGAGTAKTIKTTGSTSTGTGAAGVDSSGSSGGGGGSVRNANIISGAPVKEKAGRRFIKQAVVLTTGYGLHSAQRVAQKGEKAKAKVEKLDYKQNKVESKIASSADLSKKDKVEKLAEKRKKVLEKTLKENEKYAEKKEIIEHITEKEKSIPILGRFVYNPNKYTARDEELLARSSLAAAYIYESKKNTSKLKQIFRRIDNAKQNAKLTDDENAVIEKIRSGATASDLSEKEAAALKGLKGKPGEANKIASNAERAMDINKIQKQLDAAPFAAIYMRERIKNASKLDNALNNIGTLSKETKLTDEEKNIIEKIRSGATDLTTAEKSTLEKLRGKSDVGSKIASNAERAMDINRAQKEIDKNTDLISKAPIITDDISKRIRNTSKLEQIFSRIDNAKQNAKLTDDENAVIEKIRSGATASDLSEKEAAALKGLKGKPGEASKIASNADKAMAVNKKIKELDRRIDVESGNTDSFINKKIQELSGLDKASEEYNKKMKDINKEIMLRLKAEEKAKSSYQYKSVAPEIKRRVDKEKASSKEESKRKQTMDEIENRLKEEQRKEEERKKKEEEQKKAEGQGK